MTTRLLPPPPGPSRLVSGFSVVGTSAVALLLVLAAAFVACGSPTHVDHIVVSNPTDYVFDVLVTGVEDSGRLPLGTVGARGERSFPQVLDRGDVWVFRFEHAGEPVETVEVSRSELEGAGWRIEVPESAGTALAKAGVAPATSLDQ